MPAARQRAKVEASQGIRVDGGADQSQNSLMRGRGFCCDYRRKRDDGGAVRAELMRRSARRGLSGEPKGEGWRMSSSFRISSDFWIAAALVAAALAPTEAVARCQPGLASAPYLGAADMRFIDRAAALLPQIRAARLHASIGASVPASVRRAQVPKAVAKVLPQYRGYEAFRVGRRLAIANKHGVLSYLMPLGNGAKPGNCP